MKLIDKYIAKELIFPFFFGVIAFTSISAGIGVLPNLIGDAVRYSLGFDVVLKLFFSRLPEIIVYTFPTSILLAAIVAFNRLSSDSEVTAFKSGGISFYRMVVPALLIGFFVSITTVSFNEIVVPRANNYATLLLDKARSINKPKIKEAISIPEYENGILKRNIFATSLDGHMMKNVNVIEYDNSIFSRTIFASKAFWKPEGGWVFVKGVMHNFDIDDPLTVLTIKFDKEYINISYSPEELLITKRKKEPKDMDYLELSGYIKQRKKAGLETIDYLIQKHQKFSIPFACFIFTLLGAPMGIKPTRGSSAVGIGVSLFVVVIYYIILAIGQWLGSYSIVSPVIAAWMPNILIGIVGVFLLRTKAE
jgi:lipopolysaccharide export system permease protein